jgi:hypothetical protein
MSTPRHRLVRSVIAAAPTAQQCQRRAHTLRSRLTQNRAALARWMIRLKRAFHSMERLQARIARVERQITRLEEPHVPRH